MHQHSVQLSWQVVNKESSVGQASGLQPEAVWDRQQACSLEKGTARQLAHELDMLTHRQVEGNCSKAHADRQGVDNGKVQYSPHHVPLPCHTISDLCKI